MTAFRPYRHRIACIALVVHVLGGLFAHLCHDHPAGGCGGGHATHRRQAGEGGPACGGDGPDVDATCPFAARRAATRHDGPPVADDGVPVRWGRSSAERCAACAFTALETVTTAWEPGTRAVTVVWMTPALPRSGWAPPSFAAFLARGPPA